MEFEKSQKSPIISVVIPCYNQGKYLGEAIESVICQTLSDWEIIVVNDGSADNTKSVVETYMNKDSRIHYIYQNNGGLPKARNAGISIANGDYILCLDSDDKIEKTYLEKAVTFLIKHPEYSLFYCNVRYFGARNGVHCVNYKDYKRQLIDNSVVGPSVYRRTDWERIGGYDESFRKGCEDWEFWIRLLYPDKKVYKTEECLHYYRQYGGAEEHLSNAVAINRTDILGKMFVKHIDKYLAYIIHSTQKKENVFLA